MGITGITANKLSKISNCPTIVAAKHGKYYTGSIRGETKYHFVDFLKKSADILMHFGGHKKAAGFRFHENNLNDFKQFLTENSFLFSEKTDIDELNIDAEIPINYLGYELISLLNKLEPFGIDNPNPTLFTSGLRIINYYCIGKEKQHLKIYFETEKSPFIGLYWNKAEWFEKIYNPDNIYDVAYNLELNRYNGQTILQMIILYLNIKGN
jgi:single-stranded-DNA-specific exonuclease